jgi:hypothetical protein
MTSPKAIDFSELVALVQQPRVGKRTLAIRSGTCGSADMMQVLQAWGIPGSGMPYCIWEYVSEMLFERNQLPKREILHLLQRGRVFGAAGDLALWRQGERFAWRVIGHPDSVPTQIQGDDFWDYEPDATFHCYSDQVMLWGEWSEILERWFDDRVARAQLTYPIAHTSERDRVRLHYDTFSRNGVVEFVWLKELELWSGEAT